MKLIKITCILKHPSEEQEDHLEDFLVVLSDPLVED
jgi:hypothetical protein